MIGQLVGSLLGGPRGFVGGLSGLGACFRHPMFIVCWVTNRGPVSRVFVLLVGLLDRNGLCLQ